MGQLTDANWIFDAAMRLMDEQQELGRGSRDMTEYRQRTLGILNVLRHELFPYSDTFVHGKGGKRYICPEITSFEQAVDLDDAIAQSCMPYGLAAHLLLGENDTMAAFFNQRYEELVYKIGAKRMAQWEDIVVN